MIYATPTRPRRGRGAGGLSPSRRYDSWLDYLGEVRESGAVRGAEQLYKVETATAISIQRGEGLLTDGPFMETKEHPGGFYLIDVPDLDTALDWAAKMPIMRYGTVEVRPVREGQAWQAGLK